MVRVLNCSSVYGAFVVQTLRPLAGALASGCLALLLAAPAQAQSDSTAAGSRDGGLQEVVVTARKQAERLQEVPLAVTAFSGEQLEERRIENLQDIAQQTPGLVYQDLNGSLSVPVIRGLAQTNILGSDNNVAVFFNGIYLANSRVLDIGMIDLARVEIVKGPQSALYGQNSFAGAVNYITREAPAEFGAQGAVSIGSDDLREISFTVGGPLGERFRATLSAFKREFDGTFENQGATNNNLQGYDNKGLSIDVNAAITDAFSARLFGYYTKTDSEQVAQYLVAYNCGRANAAGAPSFYCGAIPEDRPFSISPEARGRQGENKIAALEFAYQFNEQWSLRTQSALVKTESDFLLDFDFTAGGVPFPVGIGPVPMGVTRTVLAQTWLGQGLSEWEDQSHELRVSFDGDRFDASAGLYYYDSDRRNGSSGAVDSSALAPGEVFFGFLPRLFATSNPLGAPIPSNLTFDTVKSTAAFAKVEWNLSDALRLTAELRTAKDKKGIRRVLGNAFPVTVNPTQSAEFDYTTPRVTLDWRLSPDVLIYGLYAEGARAGGFNANATRLDEQSFGPEDNATWEIGAKTEWFDRRLRVNVAGYYVDWTDLQIASRSQDPANIFSVVRNTGSAVSSGFEVETAARLTDSITFGLNYAYMNPRFKAGSVDLGLSSICGIDLSLCRKNALGQPDVGGLQLGRTINDQWSAFLDFNAPANSAGWNWFGGATWSLQGKQPLTANGTAYLDGYSVLNAHVGVRNERYEVSAWAKNLTDETYLVGASNQPRFHTGATYDTTFGNGRTIGLTGRVRFD